MKYFKLFSSDNLKTMFFVSVYIAFMVWIIFFLVSLAHAQELPTVLKKMPALSFDVSKDQETFLSTQKISNVKIIGASCGNAICYSLSGDLSGDLIKIPETVKTYKSERPITEEEKAMILKKALNVKINSLMPKEKTNIINIEERTVILTATK